MALTAILALVCIVLAFVGEVIDEKVLFGTLEWLVAAIAFNTLGVGFIIGGKRG
jgi:hypothetical protein